MSYKKQTATVTVDVHGVECDRCRVAWGTRISDGGFDGVFYGIDRTWEIYLCAKCAERGNMKLARRRAFIARLMHELASEL